MTAIKAFDYLSEVDELGGAILNAVERVMRSGWLILGPEVERFEHALAEYLGGGFGVGVASGTDALTVCLMAKGVGPGDEVITVANTATATANAIVRTGAQPVFCDVVPETALLDVTQVSKLITPRTKAVVPVHLYGNVVDVPRLLEVLDDRDIFVLEDCAQAIGATLGGRAVGTMGLCGAFSFYPTKNLGAYGDGGFCFTKDRDLAAVIRQVRCYGFEQRDYAVRPGLNSRLDELQAAILSVKLPHLDRALAKRRERAALYDAELPAELGRFELTRGSNHARHLYVVHTERRDALAKGLRAAGIGSGIHYPHPIHQMPAFAKASTTLPVTEQLCARILSLPLYPGLSLQDVRRVCDAVTHILQ